MNTNINTDSNVNCITNAYAITNYNPSLSLM